MIHRIDSPQPEPGESFGFQDAGPLAPGDVNRDGYPDLYGNGFLADGPRGSGQGRAWVFSGRDRSVPYALDDPTPTEGGQVWLVARADRLRPRRHARPLRRPSSTPRTSRRPGWRHLRLRRSRCLCVQRARGARIRQPAERDRKRRPQAGWGLAAPGDLNRDGEPDYLGGAPFMDLGGNPDQGRIYAFLSEVRCPRGTSAGVTCGALPRPGGALEITGTAGNDTTAGTGADDVIDTRGGNDVVRAGPGNDRVYGETETTTSGAATATTAFMAATATIVSSADQETTASAGMRATTAWPATRATTSSRPTRATTPCTATAATTACSGARATTACSGARAATAWMVDRAATRSSSSRRIGPSVVTGRTAPLAPVLSACPVRGSVKRRPTRRRASACAEAAPRA